MILDLRDGEAAAYNINVAFEDGSVNEHAFRRWHAKFESGDDSLNNEDRCRSELDVDNGILRVIVQQNSCSTGRDNEEQLGIAPTTISR
ncbi:hypothetical protein TNCT_355941 [Trichonephila clavata]|uniref:Transposase n=1 Tax=Trichonephila clavata TaxID=2740835 RepID=A0A8X6LHK1_TRICU|nr:hypothetical protein TNCT_355941 [Trichonephila clavata]